MKNSRRNSKRLVSVLLSCLLIVFSVLFMAATVSAAEESGVIEAYTAGSEDGFQAIKKKIVSVTFLDTVDIASDAAAEWDVSAAGDKSVTAWTILNKEETDKFTAASGLSIPNDNTKRYDLYIGAEGGVKANADSSNLFSGFTDIKAINGLQNFKTENATDMRAMFYNCSNLTALDVSSFNTQNVTDMSTMFRGCSNLISLDVSNFDTSKVTDMSQMFHGCSSLSTLNVSKFNTAKVADMSYMFYECTDLVSLDASKFDTQNVTDMSYMFYGCRSLSSLDLSTFNVQKVRDMTGMFSAQRETQSFISMNLTSLNLSGWNTKKLDTMNEMFFGCSSLTSLNMNGWNLAGLDEYTEAFAECNDLKVEAKGITLSQSSYKLFSGTGITSLNLSNSTITSATLKEMFAECKNLISIDLSDISHVAQSTSKMFYNCSALNDPVLKNFKTDDVTDMSYMFYNCSNIHVLDLSSFTTNYVDKNTNLHRPIDMTFMFYNCLSLNRILIDPDKWSVDLSRTYGRDMFTNCYVLRGEKGFGYSASQTNENYATTKYYLTSIEESDSTPPVPDDDDDYENGEIPGKDQIDQGISFFERLLQIFRAILAKFLFF